MPYRSILFDLWHKSVEGRVRAGVGGGGGEGDRGGRGAGGFYPP